MSRDQDMYAAGKNAGYAEGMGDREALKEAMAFSWKRKAEWLLRHFERAEGVTGISWGDPCPDEFTQAEWDFMIEASDAAMEQRPPICEPFHGFVD